MGKRLDEFFSEPNIVLTNYVSVALSLASFGIMIALISLLGDLKAGEGLTRLIASIFPVIVLGAGFSTFAVVATIPGGPSMPLRHKIGGFVGVLLGSGCLAWVALQVGTYVIRLANASS